MATLSSSSAMSLSLTSFFLFLLLVVSSALDMSIVDYDRTHGLSTPPAKRTEKEVREMFESWIVEHKKSYNSVGEKEVRYLIFKDNLMYIDEENAKNNTYVLGLTLFTDLTNEEYRSKYLGAGLVNDEIMSIFQNNSNMFEYSDGVELPASVDWRNHRCAVGPIRNQGSCGSCWAFATAAAVEAQHCLSTGQYRMLSPQQLLDCDSKSQGCNYGYASSAMDFIIRNKGLTSDQDYPYVGRKGQCNLNKPRYATISGYTWVQKNNEGALQAAVADRPVVVNVQSKSRGFQNYKGGIINRECGTNTDHIILNIGYGSESGQDYWIVKNSWGTGWGEKGFGRIQRNSGNANGMCGIAMWPIFPYK